MYKLKSSVSVRCFGLKWIDEANHVYEIVKDYDFFNRKIKDMVDNNFDAIELGTAGPWNREEEKASFPYVKDFVKIVKDNGILFHSAHLPFSLPWWHYASADEEVRKTAVETFKRTVDLFGEDLPNLFVIHPDGKPFNEEIRPFLFEQLTKSMLEICDYSPRTVCVENMVGERLLNNVAEAKRLLEAVPKLCMTIDVNHSILQKPEDYILQVGDRVKHLHISDNDGTGEKHWLPGQGVIDFNAILTNLEKLGYDGTFNYEVNISADDGVKKVKENYEKIFSDYNNNK